MKHNEPQPDRFLGVRQIAERLGVAKQTVLAWIRSRALRASNVAVKVSGKPRWKVAPEDFQAFLEGRRPAAPVRLPPRRKDAELEGRKRW